jgi:enoyl-CoA hydratase
MSVEYVDHGDGVALLTVQHGKANAADTDLLRALTAAMQDLEKADCRAVVLTGTGSVFSAGADLMRVLEGGDAYLDEFLPALSELLQTLFRFPKPLVAAVNGHAIAGGCVFACACDRRLMAEGKARIGLPELLVGLPFPVDGLEIMRFATGGGSLPGLVLPGAALLAADAVRHGLVDEAVPAEELLPRATTVAARLGRVPFESFRLTKEQLRRPALALMTTDRAAREAETRRAWGSAEARAAIAAYVEQTLPRR